MPRDGAGAIVDTIDSGMPSPPRRTGARVRFVRAISACAWLWALGCTTRRAPHWDDVRAPAAAPHGTGIALVALGDAGAPGRTTSQVAEQLDRVLAQQRDAGRTVVVLWLGNNLMDRNGCPSAEGWMESGPKELREVVERHRALGASSFSVSGTKEWQCGRERSDDGPWAARPGVQYIVAVDESGHTRVTTSCDARGCSEVSAPHSADRFELVMADFVPWIAPSKPGDATLAALGHLIDHVRTSRELRPPRILVSHVPVEAAGTHGLGGWRPDATFHVLPPAIQGAVRDGLFAGVIAGRDRSSYAHADIGPSIMRGDKVWLSQPTFEVVSGAASRPDALRGRWFRYGTSITLLPDIYTPSASFAVVHVAEASASAAVYGRHGLRWTVATLPLALDPPPHANERHVPVTAPCLRCPAMPASHRE